jgi:hypothetical protein
LSNQAKQTQIELVYDHTIIEISGKMSIAPPDQKDKKQQK